MPQIPSGWCKTGFMKLKVTVKLVNQKFQDFEANKKSGFRPYRHWVTMPVTIITLNRNNSSHKFACISSERGQMKSWTSGTLSSDRLNSKVRKNISSA